MNTNKLNDNIENDSLDESEIYDEEPNNFFIEDSMQNCNTEINFSALQKTLNTNINQNGIISNIPLTTYLGYKKFLSNA